MTDVKAVSQKPKKPSAKALLFVLFGLVVFSGLIFVTWQLSQKKTQSVIPEKKEKTSSLTIAPVSEIEKGKFAAYNKVPVSFTPKIAKYGLKSDFSNVYNVKDFDWLIKQNGQKLQKNGFVVTSGWNDEFFPIYEKNRYSYVPNFITTDSILHSYHLLFNSILEKLEKNRLNKHTVDLTNKMFAASNDQYQALKGTLWENAAQRNLAFFSVAAKILNDDFSIPELVRQPVEKELELISKHQGISVSPVMALGVFDGHGEVINPNLFPKDKELAAFKEDYTQYIVRGHYEKSDLLKKYFKAMMWYGRMTFRFKNDDEIKSAALISKALAKTDIYPLWETIDETISFFVGKSDDVDYYLFSKELKDVYGQGVDPKELVDETSFSKLKDKLSQLKPPAINSIPIFRADIQPDREKEIKGFRFMGQKFTIDASIFQRLVCREVGTKSGSKLCGGGIPGSRMLPKGLDIPAALGSKEAYDILEKEKETGYLYYPENMEALKSYLASISDTIWTQNLYWSWLYALRPLTEEKGDGYPLFMQNKAWVKKQLNTLLGSWAELKHDTILYSKQVYAEMGAGPGPEEIDDKGFVEPEPYVYARLASLTKMTQEGLSARGLIDEKDKEVFKIMEDLCLSLKTISEKELNGEKLTDKEYELIKGYGGSLEHLFMKAMEDDCQDKAAMQCLDDNPAAIVADVATDPNGSVLQVGIGKIQPIYVLVMVQDKLKIAKGGVFSYYEFTWPMSDRLTDSKWRNLLNSQDVPNYPEWTKDFRGN